jgi:hypothetical protein
MPSLCTHSAVERPNRRRFEKTGCPGAATLQVKDKCVIISKFVACDGSHSSSKQVVAPMPEDSDLLELVAQNQWDGVQCAITLSFFTLYFTAWRSCIVLVCASLSQSDVSIFLSSFRSPAPRQRKP